MKVLLHNRLKIARNGCKLSQAEAAKALKISPVSLSRYESGKRSPNSELLFTMSNVYGVGLDWMLTGGGDPLRSDTLDKRDTTQGEEMLGKIAALQEKVIELMEENKTLIELNRLGKPTSLRKGGGK